MSPHTFRVVEMPTEKRKKIKGNIKVGIRVQLKMELTAVGTVRAKGEAKAQWKVDWFEGRLKGTITVQSSKSLRLWELDLTGVVLGDSSGEEEGEEEEEEKEKEKESSVDYAELSKKFEAHAKSLVRKTVTVSALP